MEAFTRETTGLDVVKTYEGNIAGKTIVITGPSKDSLAAEAAFCLASSTKPPAQIILLGRTEPKIKPVIDRIEHANASIKTAFVKVDLADLQSVHICAKQVAALAPGIDVLINSAGIMAPESFETSVDGFEMQLAACHIGHFLLTGLLIPQLGAARTTRVVNLTSMGYEGSDFRFHDFNFSNGAAYERWQAYGQAKTANIMFTTELARRAASQGLAIKAFSVHPGVILSSGILKSVGLETFNATLEGAKAYYASQGTEWSPEEPRTIEQGCATILVAALATELEKENGAFLRDSQLFPASKQTPWIKDVEKARKLWELSEDWVGERFL